MKKKAQKEKIKLKKFEKNKNILNNPSDLNNSNRLNNKTNTSFNDSIQIVHSNDESNLEINIDLIQSPNTIQVNSPSFENSNLNNLNDISTFLNTKHQLENWYFELEKIKF